MKVEKEDDDLQELETEYELEGASSKLILVSILLRHSNRL